MNSFHSSQSAVNVDDQKIKTKQSLRSTTKNINHSEIQKETFDTNILKHERSKKSDKSEIFITLFELSEFIKIPESREILALKVLNRPPYDLKFDRYKKFREKIKAFYKGKINSGDLLKIILTAHKTRTSSFKLLYDSILSFNKDKELLWFEPPKLSFTYDDIRLTINPELGLQFDGCRYITKLYLKKDPIDPIIAKHAIAIMKLFVNSESENYNFAIWDVQADNFYKDEGIGETDKLKVLTAISMINKYK